MTAPEVLKPFPYQIYGARWLAARETALLGDEMGVGKTCTMILGAHLIGAETILVVVPGIARVNWKREFELWAPHRWKVGVIQNGKAPSPLPVIIISYSLLTNVKVVQWLLSRKWDLLICDEAHNLKNREAWRTRAVYGNQADRKFGLSSVAKRVWIATGTPMPNDVTELWTHCHALFPDVAPGYTQNGWKFRYARTDSEGKVRGSTEAFSKEIEPRLKPHMLRRTLEQVKPDMPPLRFSQVVLQPDKLPPKSAEVAETELVVQAAMGKLKIGDYEGYRAALQAIGEMHLASLRRWTGIAKAPAVVDFVKEELEGGLDKLVLFALHTEVFDILAQIPGSYAINGRTKQSDRQRFIDGFQGKLVGFNPQVLICHVEIASTALTLTASAHVSFAETLWVPKDVLQAAKRCHRIGQSRPVLARTFSLAGSSDETVGAVLTRKLRETTAFEKAMTTTDQGAY